MTSCGIFPSGDFRPGSGTKATTPELVSYIRKLNFQSFSSRRWTALELRSLYIVILTARVARCAIVARFESLRILLCKK